MAELIGIGKANQPTQAGPLRSKHDDTPTILSPSSPPKTIRSVVKGNTSSFELDFPAAQ